ncbi:hypothetical protein [Rubellimicrobium aerolatum]|uniref:Tat pathway signal protein n=1 Tax=Rubellimicrobium aerolatum TaxID=490979 RepID=A0ABW0SDY7_9RHOB|nr:hypothetical protein [Rubellimicrobium aerolatum]MBP1806871.1 hypothetical protein [Rubellimicrobium aerolatum]
MPDPSRPDPSRPDPSRPIPTHSIPTRPALALSAALLIPVAAVAQDAAPPAAAPTPALSLELNDAAASDGGCRLTFLVENGLGTDLAALSLETAVLGADGRVRQVTLFDFGDLPQGRPRVRQFDLAGTSCEGIGQVLVNGVASCEGTGVEARACQSGLALTSRTAIELIG